MTVESIADFGVGGAISQYLDPKMLSYVAGVGFLMIGAWTIWQGANLA